MLQIDKSTLIKYYALFNVLSLAAYNLIAISPPFASNISAQLFISLNLTFASCYLIFIDDVVLNGSDYLKSFFVACFSEYCFIWELVKLLGKSLKSTYFYSCYIYFGLILVHLGLYQRFPKVFEKFIKFNFGFAWLYIILCLFHINLFPIILCSLSGIIFSYMGKVNLDYMTLVYTTMVYPIVLLEAFIPLIDLISPDPSSNDRKIVTFCLCFIYFCLMKKNFIEKFKKWTDSMTEDLESGNLRESSESSENSRVANYSTF